MKCSSIVFCGSNQVRTFIAPDEFYQLQVLDRLAYQDNILVPISKTGLKGKAAGDSMDDDMEPQDDPLLIVHPNFSDE